MSAPRRELREKRRLRRPSGEPEPADGLADDTDDRPATATRFATELGVTD